MITNRNKRLSQESFSDGTCQKRSREHEDTNSNGFQGISNSAVTGSESMETDSHHMHDFLTEVIVDVNLKSGEKNKTSLDKAIRTAVALKNSSGGVIRWNYEKKLSDKRIEEWINAYSSKESDLGEVDPNSQSRFHNDNAYIFVRKTVHLQTQESHLVKRLAKSNKKVRSFSQIYSMLKRRTANICSCMNSTLETSPFHQNIQVLFSESQNIEFKHFPDGKFKKFLEKNVKSEISEKVKENVGAFANTYGGTLYIGITDDRKVIGQQVARSKQKETKEIIEKQIKDMIWLPYSTTTRITPEEHKHYRISFDPVEGTTDNVVIVKIHVCTFDGTVFCDKPECSIIDDSNQVVDMEFEEWLMYFQTSETNDPRYERKQYCCSSTVYKPLKGTILDKTFQDLPGQIKVHPKHAADWIMNETLEEFLKCLNGASGGHAFVQKSWDTMLGKPCNVEKPSNVICDILVCLPDHPLVLVTLIDLEEKTSEVCQYNTSLAAMTKRELAQEAGCLEEFFVKPLVLDRRDITSFSELTEKFSPDGSYPPEYSDMYPYKYCKLLEALALVLAKVNYCVTYEAQREHYFVLTEEQYKILDECYGSTSNVRITGPPGTGKTLLALERISRMRKDGCRFEEILFLCSNMILAARVMSYKVPHDKKPLCRVWNYFQCIESMKSGEFFSLDIQHIVADEIHNFKENPSKQPYRWWEQLLEFCEDKGSTCWFFYDLSQRITKEETVKIPRRFATYKLKTVIRTTRETYNFYKRFMPDTTGIGLGHDIEGPKPRILIPQQSGVSKERNLENILLYVLHDLIVSKGYSPSSISVLFADEKDETEKYSELFQKRALHCQVRNGEEVNKEGIIFDTIRRYSGDDNGIVIGFCPKFFLSPRFQDNKALMLSLCSRPQWELILVFDSTSTANSFGIQTQEYEEIQPENKQIWDFSSH